MTSRQTGRQPFEEKALEHFTEVIINKALVRDVGFGARALPTYVGEWILSRYIHDSETSDEARSKVAHFIGKYLPAKGQKDAVKDTLLRQEEVVTLLDDYSVTVNLKTGQRQLRIPFLDMTDAQLDSSIVDENPLLLTSGVWGVGDLSYIAPGGDGQQGFVYMRRFRPFQVGDIDMDYYIECRGHFMLDEWRDLLVSSMGFNPSTHTERQKMLLLTRILPFVEPRVNLVELAPKGTGKSFVYDNLSRYARVVSGGRVSPAVLFHNLANNSPGLVTRYDLVVFDEVQSVTGDSTGELIAGLKIYLESGKFTRGKTEATADAGLVMLGNITLDADRRPIWESESIFKEIPNFLRETAFIDRIHGIIPGWEMPRVSKETPSPYDGFKGDFFAEVLHTLRNDTRYSNYVSMNIHLAGSDDLRDHKAIIRLATGYLKLLFPNLQPSDEDFLTYCVNPAIELRQRVRDELHKLDAEYPQVMITAAPQLR